MSNLIDHTITAFNSHVKLDDAVIIDLMQRYFLDNKILKITRLSFAYNHQNWIVFGKGSPRKLVVKVCISEEKADGLKIESQVIDQVKDKSAIGVELANIALSIH